MSSRRDVRRDLPGRLTPGPEPQCYGGMAAETFEATSSTSDTSSTAKPLELEARILQAEAIIHRNVLWALGAGVLPLPLVDVVALTGVQVKLLKELSDLYGAPFKEGLAKKLVGALLIGIGGVGVGFALGASLMKSIPLVGTALGIISVPVTAGAFTHAVGRVFVMHFEAGGTLLDFDPKKMHAHFRREFEAAKEKVAQMQQSS